MSHDPSALVESLAIAPTFINADKRTIKADVQLGETPSGACTIHLELSVSHNKDSKSFGTHVHIEARQKESSNGFSVSHWEPMNRLHNLRLRPTPAGRYSVKALESAWDAAVAQLQDNPGMLGTLELDATEVGDSK